MRITKFTQTGIISMISGINIQPSQDTMDEFQKLLSNFITKLSYPLSLYLPFGKYIKIQQNTKSIKYQSSYNGMCNKVNITSKEMNHTTDQTDTEHIDRKSVV